MTKRWDTIKIAKWGAVFGAGFGFLQLIADPDLLTGNVAQNIGAGIGTVIGSAMVCALVGAAASGLRNLFVR